MGFFNKAREAAEQNAKKHSSSQEVTPEMRAQAAQLDEVTKTIARPLGVDPDEASAAEKPAPPAKPAAPEKVASKHQPRPNPFTRRLSDKRSNFMSKHNLRMLQA